MGNELRKFLHTHFYGSPLKPLVRQYARLAPYMILLGPQY